MAEDKSATYVRIEGEPFLSRAVAYREAHMAWYEAWGRFAEGLGAIGFFPSGCSLVFDSPGRVPEGWTRLQGRGAEKWSRPKRDHPDLARLAEMRQQWPRPSAAAVLDGALLTSVDLVRPDGTPQRYGVGGMSIMLDGPWVGWAGDVYLGYVPDAEALLRSLADEQPDLVPTPESRDWRMPEGLTRITEAEYRLVLAQFDVDEERAAGSAPGSGRES